MTLLTYYYDVTYPAAMTYYNPAIMTSPRYYNGTNPATMTSVTHYYDVTHPATMTCYNPATMTSLTSLL